MNDFYSPQYSVILVIPLRISNCGTERMNDEAELRGKYFWMYLNLSDACKVSAKGLFFGLLCRCSSDHLSAMSTLSKSKDGAQLQHH